MPNERNLIPMDRRSKSEVREFGRTGGIASGAARRRKRSLREAADLYLSLPPADKRRWNKLAKKGLAPDEIDNQMAMVVGLAEQAALGAIGAAKVVVVLRGGAPAQEIGGGVQINGDL